jgi:hypothetical protein
VPGLSRAGVIRPSGLLVDGAPSSETSMRMGRVGKLFGERRNHSVSPPFSRTEVSQFVILGFLLQVHQRCGTLSQYSTLKR